jgi:hypothetical protein
MKVRGTRSTIAVVATLVTAALMLAALVAVIGSAQAAAQKKVFNAIVDVQDTSTLASGPVRLRLTLSNDASSNQTLGSANFTAPTGVSVQNVVLYPPPSPPANPATSTSRSGWTATKSGNIVQFRSTSNPLTVGASLFADVDVTVNATTCADASWTAAAKQSNDFSGSGNDFTPGTATNRRPLGSFEIAPIETVDPDDATVNVPQIKTNVNEVVQVTAKDICGDVYTNYGTSLGKTAIFDAEPNVPLRLVGAGNLAITWGANSGIGTTTLNPKVVETGDTLVISDSLTTSGQSIDATSNVFDVVQELCTSLDATCELSNGRVRVFGAGPPGQSNQSLPDPSLGFGFSSALTVKCPGDGSAIDPLGGVSVNINPRDYPTNDPITVTVIYAKKDVPNGPATSIPFCLSKDNGDTWGSPLLECPNSPTASNAPCVTRSKVPGGDLSVAFFIRPTDPWGAGKH